MLNARVGLAFYRRSATAVLYKKKTKLLAISSSTITVYMIGTMLCFTAAFTVGGPTPVYLKWEKRIRNPVLTMTLTCVHFEFPYQCGDY